MQETVIQAALQAAGILAGASGYHLVRNTSAVKRALPRQPYLMYDQYGVDAKTLPRNGAVYLAYVDPPGNAAAMSAFVKEYAPHARILTCTRNPTYLAALLDIERGAANPDDFPLWHALCARNGVYRPAAYASLSNMNLVIEAARKAGIKRTAYRLVYADWNNTPDIEKGYDGHQYATGAYDTSILGPRFFDTP